MSVTLTFLFATAAEAKSFLASVPDAAGAVAPAPAEPATTKPRATRTKPVTDAEIDEAAARTEAKRQAKEQAADKRIQDPPEPAPAPAPAPDGDVEELREKARNVVFSLAKAGKREEAVALIKKHAPDVDKPGVKDIPDANVAAFYGEISKVAA